MMWCMDTRTPARSSVPDAASLADLPLLTDADVDRVVNLLSAAGLLPSLPLREAS